MAEPSIAPLQGNNGGKWLVLLLLLLLGGAGLWYAFGRKKPEVPKPPAPATEPVRREAFEPTLELPDLDAGTADSDAKEPTTEAKPKPRRQVDFNCNGTLAASEIRSVINGIARNQVRACYERRLKDNNLLQGTMNLRLTIGANGSVRSTSVKGTLNDNRVYSCVRNVARTWKFPKPAGGCVQTSVPFTMTPKR